MTRNSWHAQHAQTTADKGQASMQACANNSRQGTSWHTQHAQTTADKGQAGMHSMHRQ